MKRLMLFLLTALLVGCVNPIGTTETPQLTGNWLYFDDNGGSEVWVIAHSANGSVRVSTAGETIAGHAGHGMLELQRTFKDGSGLAYSGKIDGPNLVTGEVYIPPITTAPKRLGFRLVRQK